MWPLPLRNFLSLPTCLPCFDLGSLFYIMKTMKYSNIYVDISHYGEVMKEIAKICPFQLDSKKSSSMSRLFPSPPSFSFSSSPPFPINPNPYSHPWKSVVPQSYRNVWDASLSYQDQSGLWSWSTPLGKCCTPVMPECWGWFWLTPLEKCSASVLFQRLLSIMNMSANVMTKNVLSALANLDLPFKCDTETLGDGNCFFTVWSKWCSAGCWLGR